MEDQRQTTNYEGDSTFNLTPELEFYSKICTTALMPTFYVPSTNDQLNSIKTLIRKLDPEFVAKLAVYTREKMYLRTIPMVIAVELSKVHSGDNLVRKLTERVIQRADEITEILAYYAKANKKNWEVDVKSGITKKLGRLSKQLQYGVADAFDKFDEYQFGKYNRKGEVSFVDALCVTHPKRHSQERRELYQKILDDNLAVPYTWETVISEAGQTGRPMKEAWEELIDSKRLPYMATLRNLRNMLKHKVSTEHIEKVCNYISSPVAVKRSKQLPFRYLAAYRILTGGPLRSRYSQGWGYRSNDESVRTVEYDSDHVDMICDALEDAVKVSIENIPIYAHERVLLATDVSSSMQSPLRIIGESPQREQRRRNSDEGSIIEQYDIGAVLAMMLASKCEQATVGMFGDTWKPVGFPTRDILKNANEIHKREGEVGYSTNGYTVLEWAIDVYNRKGVVFDRIMMFTDGQLWDSTGRYQGGNRYHRLWKEYKQNINPDAKMVLFNLNPYGQTPVPVESVASGAYVISGWSDKIFEVLYNLEQGESALSAVKEIKL